MALTPAFTIGQSYSNTNLVIATDTSSGSDVAITQRRIYIQDYNGNYLVPNGVTEDYTEWPLATNPITLDVLTVSVAANITVQWLSVTDVVLYELSQSYSLDFYSKAFIYYLLQLQSLTYPIIQDSNYWSNYCIFWANITGADNAITIGNDLQASQACLTRANYMQQYQNDFF